MKNAEREKHDRFLRLYVENEESLNGFVRSLLFTLDDAREVMQDTAVVLWRKFEELDSPEDFESGLRDMIQKINDIGARVILCTPTVIGEKPDGTNPDDERLDQYADISRKVATETSSQLLDLRKGFITYLKEHNPKNASEGILTSDSVHMNPAGNQLLSKLVLEALQASTASKQ